MFEKCKDVTGFACLIAEVVKYPMPNTFDDAIKSKFANEWKLAITEEIQSMYEDGIWKIVPLPKSARTIDCK